MVNLSDEAQKVGEKNSTKPLAEKYRVRQHPHPHVGVNLTNRCNLRCKGCLAGLDTEFHIPDKGYISEKTIDEIIKQLKTKVEGGFRGRVVITGGEPSLHPDFIRFSQKFAEAKLPLNISTNLTWINPNLSPNKQPRLASLMKILKYPHVRIVVPMDFMHLEACPQLPKIIKYFSDLSIKNGLKYGQDYSFCRIAKNLRSIAESAVICGFEINEQNVLVVIADWRPYLFLSRLDDVINFLQISPDGKVYQNMYSMAYGKKPLGDVNKLGLIVNNFAKKIANRKGKLLGQFNPKADWNAQGKELLKIYRHLKNSQD